MNDIVVNQQMALGAETASTAMSAQAKALAEARYVIALRNPRNWDQVRQDVMMECKRPSFAHNKSAYYIKPIGEGVEGLGIRFTEVALRCMKNIQVRTAVLFEDSEKEIIRVTVEDLESTLAYDSDILIAKTVERSKPLSDGSYISMRKNSWNKPVYTVPATEDEMLNKRSALISKAQRTLALRLIPGDIQDEAVAMIKRIRADEAAKDPAAERKKIIDAFGEIGVRANDLTTYLGHSIDTCSPAEIVNLRGIYGAISQGEATWQSVIDNRAEAAPKDADTGKPAWTDADFYKALPNWAKLIEKKNKTPAEIITTAETKAPLTAPQKQRINDLAAPVGQVASAEQVAVIREHAAAAAINEADILKKFDVESIEQTLESMVDDVLKYIANPMGE
jgi:hypothetical protein